MPLIAMTREMGSLGKDVAATVAERLGKQVVHHEIIDNLANKMRLRKSHVIRFLDGKAGIWERLTTDKTSLSIYTADETFSLAERQEVAVIHGWGSAHLLRAVPHVISVRVCAPLEVRVQRMMKRLDTGDRDIVANEITLAGLVEPGAEPKDAADVAGKVSGVRDVKNQLRVAGPVRTLHIDESG